MPPGLRRNSIAVGMRVAITMASWPAPLGIRFAGKSRGLHRFDQVCGQPLVHRNRRLIHLRRALQGQSAAFGDRAGRFDQFVHGAQSDCIVRMPHIESKRDRPCDHVACVGRRVDLAHRGHQPVGALGSFSTAAIHSAAPASASWRRCIGVVPA